MNSITIPTLKAQFGSYREDFFRLKAPVLRGRTTVFGVGALRQQRSFDCYLNDVAHI